MGMTECCETCRFKYDLVKFDYTSRGCDHSKQPGFVCMIFGDGGDAIWMYGTSADKPGAICEGYEPKEGK